MRRNKKKERAIQAAENGTLNNKTEITNATEYDDIIKMEDLHTDESMLKNRDAKRAFFISFFTTISVICLIFGMLTVDFHGRRMSLNDDSPVIVIQEDDDGTAVMSIHTLGYDDTLEVTALVELWHKFKEFCCLPD